MLAREFDSAEAEETAAPSWLACTAGRRYTSFVQSGNVETTLRFLAMHMFNTGVSSLTRLLTSKSKSLTTISVAYAVVPLPIAEVVIVAICYSPVIFGLLYLVR